MLNTAMPEPLEAPSLLVASLQAGQLCGVFRPEAAAHSAGEGKAKTSNLLLGGPRVLNHCKLAETKGGMVVAAKNAYEDDKRLHFP